MSQIIKKNKIKPKSYFIFVLGCQMNEADAEKVDASLASLGWQRVIKETEASLIVVVACSVRQSAVDKIYGKAKNWQSGRKQGKIKTILTGCFLPRDRKRMLQKFDWLLPIEELDKLGSLLGVKKSCPKSGSYLCLPAKRESAHQAYVPIMTGCNNFCSYCAVPYTRGREKSRLAREVIKECAGLIKQGYKEITLLGQNVNSYSDGCYNFSKLLKKIDQIPGDYWLRFITSHPKDFSNELLAVMKSGRHITPYLHLPIQSGDGSILKAMNRHYTVKHYLELIKKVREQIPGIMLSTDIIVGFPGESRKKFENSKKVFAQVKFDMAYIAQYSPRAGTAAYKIKETVSKKEKKNREEEINNILKGTALEKNQKYLGRTIKVLVEKYKNGKCWGKTDTFKTVGFTGPKRMIGQFKKVKINRVDSWGLFGRI
ncbi:MAG: tRNA (N6-isopentenyl adenosine(37)-C2)-methylthiotransferase MiaB [Patescibacteria group bacterium]